MGKKWGEDNREQQKKQRNIVQDSIAGGWESRI